MAKTNHINYTDVLGRIYCYAYNEIVLFDQKHIQEKCARCSYFLGSAQGNGVECFFSDGSNEPIKVFCDPVDSQTSAHEAVTSLGKEE